MPDFRIKPVDVAKLLLRDLQGTHGTVFMTYERAFLVPKRGHAVDDAADY